MAKSKTNLNPEFVQGLNVAELLAYSAWRYQKSASHVAGVVERNFGPISPATVWKWMDRRGYINND
jgi:hypothetical protein